MSGVAFAHHSNADMRPDASYADFVVIRADTWMRWKPGSFSRYCHRSFFMRGTTRRAQ